MHSQQKYWFGLLTDKKYSYNLSERPTMTVENDNVRLKSKTVDLLYAVTDIQRVTFDDQTDGIESATTTNKKWKCYTYTRVDDIYRI